MRVFKNLSLIVSFSILGLFACQQAEEKTAEIVAEAQFTSVEMKVEGMVCAMGCAKFIEDKVAGEAGVTESKVDFEEGMAYFTYDANKWTAEELEEYIDGIHDGQYDATIVAQNQSSSAEATEDKDEDEDEDAKSEDLEDEDEDGEDVDVAQVVSKVQNISFPELLTYFMRRL